MGKVFVISRYRRSISIQMSSLIPRSVKIHSISLASPRTPRHYQTGRLFATFASVTTAQYLLRRHPPRERSCRISNRQLITCPRVIASI